MPVPRRISALASALAVIFLGVFAALAADAGLPHMLSPEELRKVLPQSFFYAGQSAPVQLRNSAGVKLADGKMLLAGLVDSSGYSSSIAEKYQGFLLSEIDFRIAGITLAPGAYGFGTLADGSFVVSDIGANQLLSEPTHTDAGLRRPVPLRITEPGSSGGLYRLYRLYLGRKYVSFEFPSKTK